MKYRSRNREVILEILRGVDTHPTAEELYLMVKSEMPDIGIATVYRNLEQLRAAGEVLALNGDVRRFDGNVQEHLHVRCQECSRIFDIHENDLMHSYLELKNKAEQLGLGLKIEFEKICPHCREKTI